MKTSYMNSSENQIIMNADWNHIITLPWLLVKYMFYLHVLHVESPSWRRKLYEFLWIQFNLVLLTSNCMSAQVYDVEYVEFTEEEPIATSICFSNTAPINLSSFTTVSAIA